MKVKTYESAKGWFWQIKVSGGNTISHEKGYKSENGAIRALMRFSKNMQGKYLEWNK